MTRHRQQFAREGSGYNFNSQRTQALTRKMGGVARQNAARVPCSICNLLILPGAMHVHMDIVHGEEA